MKLNQDVESPSLSATPPIRMEYTPEEGYTDDNHYGHGGPWIPPGDAWYWSFNGVYYVLSLYALFEWLRFIMHERKILTLQTNIIFLCALWAFLNGTMGFLYTPMEELIHCYGRQLILFFVTAYFPLLIYSLILLFFVDCYVYIRTMNLAYKFLLYSLHTLVMMLVVLVFTVILYFQCDANLTDRDDYDIHSGQDYTITSAVLRVVFFLAGVIVFFMVRSLQTLILTAKHDVVRGRFQRVLFIYLPTLLGRVVSTIVYRVSPGWSFNNWQTILWILLVDIFPTLAVVISFRSQGPRKLDSQIAPQYAAEGDAPASPEPMAYSYIEDYSYEDFSPPDSRDISRSPSLVLSSSFPKDVQIN